MRTWVNPFYSPNFAKFMQLHPLAIWWCKCYKCKKPIYLIQQAIAWCHLIYHDFCFDPDNPMLLHPIYARIKEAEPI